MMKTPIRKYRYLIILSLFTILLSIGVMTSYESYALDLSKIRWLVIMDCNDNYSQDAFQHLRDIGVQAVVEDIRWSNFEATEGSFDFSDLDTHKEYCENVGLYWFPQIALHYVPSWLYAKDSSFYLYDKNGNKAVETIPNPFHPDTLTYVRSAINAFIDHYGAVPFIYISSGQYGESYYPDAGNYYAFDDYIVAAWRAYTRDPTAVPYSGPSSSSGSGGSLRKFHKFWYAKMHDYIGNTHQLVYSRIPSTPHGLKVSVNEDLGQRVKKQIDAALPYNLRVISHGGPTSQTVAVQETGDKARNKGVIAWVESFLHKPWLGEANGIKETYDRLYFNRISGYLYATMFSLVNFTTGIPSSGPREEFYRYKKLIEDCGFGFETWDTGFWTAETSGTGQYLIKSNNRKDGKYSLYLSVGPGTGSVNFYRDVLYDTGVEDDGDIVYPGGDVVIDFWRYLNKSDSPSSMYIKVEGYDSYDSKLLSAVYWCGSYNDETAHGSYIEGTYYLKVELDNSTKKKKWLRTTKMVNQDFDNQFGSGVWNNLGIKRLRIINRINGSGECSGYFDEVRLRDILPYVINGNFEKGDFSYWDASSRGCEISSSKAKGSYSLHLTDGGSCDQYVDYSSGPVVLNTQRYLVSSTGSSYLYWKVEGYGADGSLKCSAIYSAGAGVPTGSSVNKRLKKPTKTRKWITKKVIVNEDYDNAYGAGKWHELGITELRLIVGVGGSGSIEAYVDNVGMETDGLPVRYFAEGSTRYGFDERISVLNPTGKTASIVARFIKSSGNPLQIMETIAPRSRETLNVNGYDIQASLSTVIESTNGVRVIPERITYFWAGTMGYAGGHSSSGGNPAATWYLAEGSTSGYDERILVQNPSVNTAKIKVTFIREDGSRVNRRFNVGARKKRIINVNNIISNSPVSAIVKSTNGVDVLAARSMYWDAGGYDNAGGHCSNGSMKTARKWYFAEGATTGSFKEWITILNPNSRTANVRVTFYKASGGTVTRNLEIGGRKRDALYVNDIVPDESFSTLVQSTNGVKIVTERSMYWNSNDDNNVEKIGGHCGPGVIPATTCYLPVGNTSEGYEEYITIFNPNKKTARLKIYYYKNSGSRVKRTMTLGGTSRIVINVNDIVSNQEVAAEVISTNGVSVVVERTMYWEANEIARSGGLCSSGIN